MLFGNSHSFPWSNSLPQLFRVFFGSRFILVPPFWLSDLASTPAFLSFSPPFFCRLPCLLCTLFSLFHPCLDKIPTLNLTVFHTQIVPLESPTTRVSANINCVLISLLILLASPFPIQSPLLHPMFLPPLFLLPPDSCRKFAFPFPSYYRVCYCVRSLNPFLPTLSGLAILGSSLYPPKLGPNIGLFCCMFWESYLTPFFPLIFQPCHRSPLSLSSFYLVRSSICRLYLGSRR